MVLFATTFGLYVLSSVAYCLVDGQQENTPIHNKIDNFYIFTSSLTQVMICYIFWYMDTIKFVPVPDDWENDVEEFAYEEVRVDRTDSDFDLQLKMYQ